MFPATPSQSLTIPRVLAIEPAASTVPANVLRWYVHFDRSARGLVQQSALSLEEGDATSSLKPFVDFGQELWSPDGRRMTVLFDPGRVKRDVKGLEESASVLRPGVYYRWNIDETVWNFRAGPPVYNALAPERWILRAPASQTAPLEVFFDRVMDSALLVSQVCVKTEDGLSVSGEAIISHGGRCWRFDPAQLWFDCHYHIHFAEAVEDVCGNRLSGALDHDGRTAANKLQSANLSFQISEGW